MIYSITRKKSTRLLFAVIISLAMIFSSFAMMPVEKAHAAQNDTLLTVTLTGAKASTYQDYYELNDSVYVPSTDGSGNGSQVTATSGSIYVGQPLPYQTDVYDSATLYVYSPKAEQWIDVASDTLYDEDAATVARYAISKQIDDSYTTPPALTEDAQQALWNTYYGTIYSKPAFEFRFDSKYKGMKATVKYYNNAQTKAAYGQIATQTIGGYFGDIDDYKQNKVTAIETFTLAAGAKKFALKKAVFETLKVTPKTTPIDKDGEGIDPASETYTITDGYAWLISNDRGSTIDYLSVPNIELKETRWDPATKANKTSYLLGDPNNGTYIFPALQGQKLIFSAGGSYQDGSKDGTGALKPEKSFQNQWLGGYKSLTSDTIIGNPKTVKKITVGKSNKTVGTIKLTKGTATIKGTLPNSDGGVYATGVAKDRYYGDSASQETVVATFAEYQADEDKKTTSKKDVTRQNVYSTATQAEYIADQTRNTIESPAASVSILNTSDYVAIPYAEYKSLPEEVRADPTQDPVTGIYTYYKHNVIEVTTEDAYNALPSVLQFDEVWVDGANKYYQYNYTEIDSATYATLNALSGNLVTSGGGKFYNRNLTFYKQTIAAASEAEYIAYVSSYNDNTGRNVYPDVVRRTRNVVEVSQADYNALPYQLQYRTWTAGDGTIKYYKYNNYTEITADAYNALPYVEDYFGQQLAVSSGGKYYQASWIQEVTKDVYDATPDQLRAKTYVQATATAPAAFKYFKFTYTYNKTVAPYRYWKQSPTYKIENVPAGVYVVSWGGQAKVITVKNGKTYTYNFKEEKFDVNGPSVNTNITGTKKKGQKLTAAAYIDTASFGSGKPAFSYYWTDGTKIISKKAALKLSKTTAKKNLWVLSVAKIGSNVYPSNYWQAAPGNKWGAIGYDVNVTGTFKKGKKVKAVIANAQVAGVKYKYQWLRNGKAIKKATKATYKITKADKGKKISVKVTATRTGFTSKTVKSKATKSK